MTDWHLMRTLDWNSDVGVVINAVLYWRAHAKRPMLPSQIYRRSDRVFPLGLMHQALAGGLACGDLVLMDDGYITRADQVDDLDAFNKDETPMGWVAARRSEIEWKRSEMQSFAGLAA